MYWSIEYLGKHVTRVQADSMYHAIELAHSRFGHIRNNYKAIRI